MDDIKLDTLKTISDLFNKYNKVELYNKINYYIKKELPERLDLYIKKEERKQQIEEEIDYYINDFLINRSEKYIYISRSEIYIKYDGKNFQIENESNIIHTVLQDISEKKNLIQWKHKIKNLIIKRIKDTCFFSVIPESNTIQKILSFFTSTLFSNKDLSKYFLTILGDNILKKNNNILHILDNKSKNLIQDLEFRICDYFKNVYHCNQSFKFAWNNYDYEICRIVTFSPLVEKQDIWINFIKQNFLNIISVSVYYSKRYTSSENFINTIPSNIIKNKINFLKNKNYENIIDLFIDNVKIVENENSSISLKEIHYLWKIFLNDNELPYILFLSKATNVLKSRFTFKNNKFFNIKSYYLEKIKILENFWKDFIIKENGEEIEVSELCDIYNDWIKSNNEYNELNYFLDEEFFTRYISDFYEIEIKGKNIENMKCTLWDKKLETDNIFKDLKIKYKFSQNLYESSVDSIYTDYCNTCSNKEYNYKVVSKGWFTKYINQVIPEKYIIKNRILNNYWRD